MSIEFEGMDEVLDSLDAIADTEKFTKALTKACLLVEREARKKAPKGDTGDLRKTITHEVEGTTGIVYSPLLYAPYVEYGTGIFAEGGNGRQDVPWMYRDDKGEFHITSGMPPSPFMRPALNENREQILRILKEGLME